MRLAYYVFKAILPATSSDAKDSEQTDFYEEQKITMMDAFNLVPKVVELIADKPTDLYVTMQLLNTCTVDSMLKEQNLKTLMTLQDRMNVAKMHMVSLLSI
uniref:Uncharacterized protein n=1 Tax=Ditylenchus dipsaci TaxID=166011 RepID=A0A915D8V3_9BILA